MGLLRLTIQSMIIAIRSLPKDDPLSAGFEIRRRHHRLPLVGARKHPEELLCVIRFEREEAQIIVHERRNAEALRPLRDEHGARMTYSFFRTFENRIAA